MMESSGEVSTVSCLRADNRMRCLSTITRGEILFQVVRAWLSRFPTAAVVYWFQPRMVSRLIIYHTVSPCSGLIASPPFMVDGSGTLHGSKNNSYLAAICSSGTLHNSKVTEIAQGISTTPLLVAGKPPLHTISSKPKPTRA